MSAPYFYTVKGDNPWGISYTTAQVGGVWPFSFGRFEVFTPAINAVLSKLRSTERKRGLTLTGSRGG